MEGGWTRKRKSKLCSFEIVFSRLTGGRWWVWGRRKIIFLRVYFYYYMYLRAFFYCWTPSQKLILLGFWVHKHHHISIYLPWKPVVSLLVWLPVEFIVLIFLCDIFTYCASLTLFHQFQAPGKRRSGGPCCILCLNPQPLIGSEMYV